MSSDHRNGCTACGPGGFLTPDSVDSMPDGRSVILPLDARHQGWLELPHGGILMSAILDTVHHGFDDPVFWKPEDAIRASFRWGGPGLFLGDLVRIRTRKEAGAIRASVTRPDAASPSLTAAIDSGPARCSLEEMDPVLHMMEALGRDARDKVIPLPYASQCFVCGNERSHPGLGRRFYCLEDETSRIVFTSMGIDPEDESRLFWFRLSDQELHPGALASVLDETLGWSGFLATRQGGITVKLDIDFLRRVEIGERMICFAACTAVRGRSPERLFWYAAGGIVPLGGTDLSPIALAKGQWLAVPRLTEEMKNHLRPAAWLERWFSGGCP
ncbi:MAG: hypothetical protein AB1640_14425 [bacterium]